MAYSVLFSPDINQSDVVSYNGKNSIFELNKTNDTDDDLIILYMYVLPKFPTHGIKVGMATCHKGETFSHALTKRVGEQVHELALTNEQFEKYGQAREIIYWGVCLDARNEKFKDYHVHSEILKTNAGLTEKDQEWFTNVPQEELIEIFDKIRNTGSKKEIFTPRKEQQECIDALKAYFENKPKGGRFLLNCKMRFGKSFTTYKYCEEANLNKILILTFIPAVESSWRDDLLHIKKDYKYLTDKHLRDPFFHLRAVDSPYVLFLSLQNFLGKDKDGEVKEKITKLQDEHFDLVILDEYHFGAWNERTQEKLEDLDSDYSKALNKTKDVISKFGIATDKIICLSGTPFKALSRGEFTKEATYTYSYFDEQKNKYPDSDKNPPSFDNIDPNYAHFPDMKIFGYNMSTLFGALSDQVCSNDKLLGKSYFSLNKYFETRKDSNPNESLTFVYEEEIKQWLEIIKGRSTYGSDFPYSNMKMLNNNKHTLWLMPSVNSCIAMSDLLLQDEYFSKYEIINLSDNGVGSGVDAFDFLMEGISRANNTNKLGSIALTVNKLTIGVTVKEWFSVFVLKDLASPEQYFQSIFRVQTPLVKNGQILKKDGYVYDFNIDRAAALLLRYAEESGKSEGYTKLDTAKLIVKYLPIFMNGDMSSPIAYEVFYELANFGDQSKIPLSRKITNLANTTHIADEETLAEMLNDPEVNDIFKKIFAHSKFKDKKQGGNKPVAPDDENGHKTTEAKLGRDRGYKLGLDDSKMYTDLDDSEVQKTFENKIAVYVKQFCPKEYDEKQVIYYTNGFKKGYELGVNVPIKKLQCGKEDGIKFAENEVRKEFGVGIIYTKDTRAMILNFVNKYLNDISHIPPEYRGMLYKRWYYESFKFAVKQELTPKVPTGSNDTSVADCNNALRHILSRLIEFLYISVYRETTFSEIFKNADPDIFLEAVGIKKEDFEVLNKYKIFEENTLNNYIHEFFVNESIGATLNLDDPNIRNQYRNSFDWFGYGVDHEKVQKDVKEYVEEVESESLENSIEEYENESSDNDKLKNKVEEMVFEQNEVHKLEVPQIAEPQPVTDEKVELEAKPELTDLEKIINYLATKSNPVKVKEIAMFLNISKETAEKILLEHKDKFSKSIFGGWKLLKK